MHTIGAAGVQSSPGHIRTLSHLLVGLHFFLGFSILCGLKWQEGRGRARQPLEHSHSCGRMECHQWHGSVPCTHTAGRHHVQGLLLRLGHFPSAGVTFRGGMWPAGCTCRPCSMWPSDTEPAQSAAVLWPLHVWPADSVWPLDTVWGSALQAVMCHQCDLAVTG